VASLTVRDETMTGKETGSFVLLDLPDTITVEELIRWRVREEVERHNAGTEATFRGLVQPTAAEEEINEPRERRRIDPLKQADVAVKAFSTNGFVLLVGDRQVDELDEVVDVIETDSVAFVRLVALVGG
jgi:hypothetical protein